MDHQAFAQLLGNYGEFLGALAVVATLFYLAVQVRHTKEATDANTKALEESQKIARTDSYLRRADVMERSAAQAALSEDLANIMLKSSRGGVGELTELERIRLVMWERARMIRVESQFFQWQQGLLDDEYYEHQFKFVIKSFAPLWKELGLRFERPSLRDEVARVLAK
jgi:hypothetical protein